MADLATFMSYEEACEQHEVLDALEEVDARQQADARAKSGG